jgi:protein-disulfide isomerase
MQFSKTFLIAGIAAAALSLAGCKKSADNAGNGSAPASTASTGPAGPAPAGGWVEQVVQTEDGGFRMGNPNAQAKLVEFGSRTCPHCGLFTKEAMPEIKQMVATGKLSYEFNDFAIHAPDVAAILLGQCNGPSTFFPILEGMMADQETTLPKLEKLPDGFAQSMTGKSVSDQAAMWADYLGYTKFVGQRGVPEGKAKACLADAKAIDALGKNMQTASTKFNIQGTPTFVINGEVIGTAEWQDLKPKLTAAMGG